MCDVCADVYALLKALQSIENGFTRGRIEPSAYTEMCNTLLTQWQYAYSGDVKAQVRPSVLAVASLQHSTAS